MNGEKRMNVYGEYIDLFACCLSFEVAHTFQSTLTTKNPASDSLKWSEVTLQISLIVSIEITRNSYLINWSRYALQMLSEYLKSIEISKIVLSESGPIISLEPANLNQVQTLMNEGELAKLQRTTNYAPYYYGNNQFASAFGIQTGRVSSLLGPNNNENNNNNNARQATGARLENEILGPLVKCNSARSLPASLLRFYVNNRLVSEETFIHLSLNSVVVSLNWSLQHKLDTLDR